MTTNGNLQKLSHIGLPAAPQLSETSHAWYWLAYLRHHESKVTALLLHMRSGHTRAAMLRSDALSAALWHALTDLAQIRDASLRHVCDWGALLFAAPGSTATEADMPKPTRTLLEVTA